MLKNFSDKMMNRFFRKVSGVKWDLLSGKVGIQTEDGISTLEATRSLIAKLLVLFLNIGQISQGMTRYTRN